MIEQADRHRPVIDFPHRRELGYARCIFVLPSGASCQRPCNFVADALLGWPRGHWRHNPRPYTRTRGER